MAVKKIRNNAARKKAARPYGLSEQDWNLARKIAREQGVLPSDAARYVKAHRLNSRKMCQDY